MEIRENRSRNPLLAPLIAGAVAGAATDLSCYPLDTVKTRLQSRQGFHRAGGFRGLYKGLAPVAVTTMPAAALFFASYETTKALFAPLLPGSLAPVGNCAAAALAELSACLIRVPADIVKQRKQIDVNSQRSSLTILVQAYKSEGVRKGLFRGFLSTLARDLPFGCIDMPIWEYLKTLVKERNNGHITSLQSATCGAVGTTIASILTTPLDLAKTRITLAPENTPAHKLRMIPVLVDIYRVGGCRGLFAGCTPRTLGFTFGMFIFIGVYEECKRFIE